ncbi:Protein SDA1 [Chamberlinius hualienensis]
MKINNQLPNNLPQLQNLIKKDPESYYEEFLQQYRHFQSRLEVFHLQPKEYSKAFDESIMFLAQVSYCYPNDLADYHEKLMTILKNEAQIMDPEMRTTICKALILMRNRNLVAPTELLKLFFDMLHCHDKSLRKFLQTHIITDIKNVNSKHKNAKLNTCLQNFMFSMLKDDFATASKMSLDIMIELYRKNIWNDAKTVNVITLALFSKIARIVVAALTFFLGRDEDDEKKDGDDSSSDDDCPTVKDVAMANRVNKKSKKRQKKLDQTKRVIKKHKNEKKAPVFNFSALHLIHDPQELAEKLFHRLEGMTERYEVKILIINLISRLIGVHELHVFNFYPFLQRFLLPHQREVTKLLVFAAQSAHELVPPDIIEGVLNTIAMNFVAESNSHEVVAVGLNAIRELCARCPLAMSAELLSDISRYKNNKSKSIAMAAKSVIQLYRVLNPNLLHKKDKGRPTQGTVNLEAREFGQISAKDYIPGTEVLPEEEEEPVKKEGEDWESTSEDEDGSDGEWIDIIHSDDEQAKPVSDNLTHEEREMKAAAVSQGRILSQEEFQKIRVNQLAAMVEPAKGRGGANKRKPEESTEIFEKKELVRLSEIERIHKKPRHDKESRLATVQAGREGREKFGKIFKRMNPHASTNNKEKAKNKAFSMIRHKMKKKNKRSFREKQIALRNALIKRKKMK